MTLTGAVSDKEDFTGIPSHEGLTGNKRREDTEMSDQTEEHQVLLGQLIKKLAEGISDTDLKAMLSSVGRKKPSRPGKTDVQSIKDAKAIPPEKISLSVEEAGGIVGLSRSAIYEYIARGDLPAFKIGKRRLILASDLKAWINRKAKEGRR
jgi:excisionase family DNA binding protein